MEAERKGRIIVGAGIMGNCHRQSHFNAFWKEKKYKITIKRKFNLVRNFNPLESVK